MAITTNTAKTAVTVELRNRAPLTIGLERPSEYPNLESFVRCWYPHAARMANERGLGLDEFAQLFTLGETGEMLMLALTDNRRCCYVEVQPGTPWVRRQPVTEFTWFTVMREHGVGEIKRVVDAFIGLFPEAR